MIINFLGAIALIQQWLLLSFTAIFFYLTSIPGMRQSIKKGLKTPIEKCDEEIGW